MSDQSPPPKPKPGSLRDRIAAFEKPAAASSGNAPPPPRPKPGNISWKPKQLSPPSSPPAAGAGAGDGGSTTTTSERFKPTGGMSASDAKESIRSGGSLKERMAALQGKGGFGGPPPPVSPKPAVEKPKWKPPPQVARASADDDDDNDEHDGEVSKKEEGGVRGRTSTEEDVKSPAGSARSLGEELAPETQTQSHAEGGEEQPSEEVDPEEEERQRRAAIAARMAKLGGARVGMGPPVFGRPMVPKKPEGLKQQETPTSPPLPPKGKEEAEPVQEGQPESHKSPTLGEAIDSMQEKTKSEDTPAAKEEPKCSDSSSLLSPDSNTSSPQPPSRTPNSMPLPAAPRRAGPPRRKVKSPAPESTPEPSTTAEEAAAQEEPPKEEEKGVTITESESQSDPSSLATPGGDVQEEIGHVTPTHVEPEPDTEAPGKVLDDEKPIVAEEPPTMKEAEGVPVRDDEDIVEPSSEPKGSTGSEAVADTEETAKETASEVAEEEEDDEEMRRKRIAERVAKMGGFNPFSLPPQRRPSSDEVPTSPKSEIEPSPKSPSTQSMRKSSTGSGNFPPPPVRRSSQMSAKSPASSLGRKASVDSATSMNVEEENVSAGLARRMSSHDGNY
ncbi:hypothetical protein K435DRAFT_759714 [Dendrothele bispora CBS 962.96]|uniref:Uncharacterized protein n=1 Tax=Dendrothele bispora (strain CBS 962.96) TaxID=1314807 RepID=A0A4S8LNN8_DENBC|nr:hypothetical protein K435DRAFT_759714 [Dendrothele bispora CBS 962.96]